VKTFQGRVSISLLRSGKAMKTFNKLTEGIVTRISRVKVPFDAVKVANCSLVPSDKVEKEVLQGKCINEFG
jgi:hypothetical protein